MTKDDYEAYVRQLAKRCGLDVTKIGPTGYAVTEGGYPLSDCFWTLEEVEQLAHGWA